MKEQRSLNELAIPLSQGFNVVLGIGCVYAKSFSKVRGIENIDI